MREFGNFNVSASVNLYKEGSTFGSTGKELDLDALQDKIRKTMEYPIPVYLDGTSDECGGLFDPFEPNRLVGFAQLMRDAVGIDCKVTYIPTTPSGERIMNMPKSNMQRDIVAKLIVRSGKPERDDKYLDVIDLSSVRLTVIKEEI